MNYLAHLLLSGKDPEMMLGGFLGDFVKGPLSRTLPFPPAVIAGIHLHRRIDVFTDSHPIQQQSVARLGPDLRRIGGIAIDVCYDHFLARHWHRYHPQALDDYCQSVYSLLQQHHHQLPEAAQRFSERAREHRLLQGYSELDILEPVLARIAGRLSRPTPLIECYPRIVREYSALESDFLTLFPALMDFASNYASNYASEHASNVAPNNAAEAADKSADQDKRVDQDSP